MGIGWCRVANNRMWVKNPKTGKKALLAKYYPSTGWYAKLTLQELHDVLCPEDREQTDDHDLFGKNPFVLEYEVQDD